MHAVRRLLRQRDTMADCSALISYAVVAFASLFILVDPLAPQAAVPVQTVHHRVPPGDMMMSHLKATRKGSARPG